MNKIFCLKIILAIIFLPLLSNSQGLKIDKRSYSEYKKLPKVGITRSLNNLSSASLEKYLPHTMDQGASGMCMAYSMATCRTILYARNNNITDINIISSEAFSPYYIYFKYKSTLGEDWQGGLSLYTERINQFGYAKLKDIEYPYYYPFSQHALWDFSLPSYVDLDIQSIKEEKFDNIFAIYSNSKDSVNEKISMIKSELSKERPVLFGFYPLPDSWNNIKNEYWSDTIKVACLAYDKMWNDKFISDDECDNLTNDPYSLCNKHKPDDYYESGGHAMVVIAFDNDKYGGSFQIINSWGNDFGDNGKVWVPYKDFVKYAYGIQSFDKKRKSVFDKNVVSSDLIKSINENIIKKKEIELYQPLIDVKVKDFSSSVDLDWLMFTQMSYSGGIYAGGRVNGLKEGYGTYTFSNGLEYEGQWEDDKMNGAGKLQYLNIISYKGSFNDGFFQGEGVFLEYDKLGFLIKSYDGQFQNGRFINGLVKEDVTRGFWIGFRYEGEFSNYQYNGYGKMMSYDTEMTLEGDFIDGICDGQGTIIFADKKYIGEWYLCYPFGKGVCVYDSGLKEKGEWDGWDLLK